MKILLTLTLFSLFFSTSSFSQQFIPGTHYSIIEGSGKPDQKHVTEYFSYSCPGCYALEPKVEALLSALPEVHLRKVHAQFGGRKATLSQKVFAVSSLLKAESHSDAIFERIHVRRDSFDNDEEIARFFIELGYEKQLVLVTLKSFSANSLIRKMSKEVLAKKVASVPTLVVNGQYKINFDAIRSTKELIAITKYLYHL